MKMHLLAITSFQEGVMPFRYLLIPLASKKLKIAHYNPLMDSLIRKIKGWPKSNLFYEGKHILSSQYSKKWNVTRCLFYHYLTVLLSASTLFVGALCEPPSTPPPPIVWCKMCKRKEVGGLGFRDLRAWNKALLARVF